MARKIVTIPIWKSQALNPGDVATSDVIDLREDSGNGIFSLSSTPVAGTAGTCGTTVFTYSGCSTRNGTYVTPASAVAIGTSGTANTGGDIFSFNPEPMPFMKIIATQTGAAGKDSKITVELNIQ